MPKVSEQILEVLGVVEATLEHLEQLDRLDLAQTMIDATVQEYERTSARLQAIKAQTVQADAAYQSKHHLINEEAAERLRAAYRDLAEARAELSSIQQGE